MSFPRTEHPISTYIIPSTKKKVRFRPFLYKEEKLLLMAQQSGETKDILQAMQQIVINCALDDLDIENIATFDLEYLYLKLYASSVKDIIILEYINKEEKDAIEYIHNLKGGYTEEKDITKAFNTQFNCNLATYKTVKEVTYKFHVKLADIDVKFPEHASNVIKFDAKSGIILSYPKINLTMELNDKSGTEALDTIIKSCIDKYFVGEEMYTFNDADEKEKQEFIDNIPVPVFEEMKKFFTDIPKIEYEIKYKNTLGHENTITLRRLEDFFSLG